MKELFNEISYNFDYSEVVFDQNISSVQISKKNPVPLSKMKDPLVMLIDNFFVAIFLQPQKLASML